MQIEMWEHYPYIHVNIKRSIHIRRKGCLAIYSFWMVWDIYSLSLDCYCQMQMLAKICFKGVHILSYKTTISLTHPVVQSDGHDNSHYSQPTIHMFYLSRMDQILRRWDCIAEAAKLNIYPAVFVTIFFSSLHIN